jgi:hypothetical protein
MLRVFYCNGEVDVHKGGEGLATTPRNARRWAKAFIKDQDVYKTEFWNLDEDGVESCETFKNTENLTNISSQ